jgi:uncharacterized damage-inducible protein DinB
MTRRTIVMEKEKRMTSMSTIANARFNPARTTLLNLLFCFLFGLVAPVALRAADAPQTAPAARASDPLSAHNKYIYRGLKAIVLRAAEQMPAGKYDFKPAETVRTFGQIVGHIADSQYTFCSAARAVENPRPKVEQSKTSRPELIAALQEAFAFCDAGYDGLTDATAAQMVKLGRNDTPKLGVFMVNNVHSTEHYGNLVTYLRMNDLVPPTSDPEFMKQLSRP